MDEQTQSTTSKETKRRWRRGFIATLIGGLLVGAGVTVFAHGDQGFGHHHRFGAMTPEELNTRVEFMVQRMLSGVNVNDVQRTQINDLAKAAANDLAAIRKKHHEARAAAMDILTKPTVDRGALETLRVAQMGLADQASKRLTQAIADIADVLTPEQRLAVAERMKQHRDRHSS